MTSDGFSHHGILSHQHFGKNDKVMAFLVFLEMAPEGSLPVGRFLNNIASRCPILTSIFEPNLGQID